MKTIRQFFAILWIVISLVGAGTLSVSAYIGSFSLPFGDVEHYAATNSRTDFLVIVNQKQPDGSNVNFGRTLDSNTRFTCKADVDAFFRSRLQIAMDKAIATTKTNVVRFDDEFYVVAESTGHVGKWPNEMWVDFFFHRSTFKFIKGENGYITPDVSDYDMELSSRMTFYIPEMNWAIWQVYDNVGEIFDWENSILEPDSSKTGVDPTTRTLTLRTEYLLYETPNRLKVMFGSGSEDEYHVLDGNGVEKPGIIPIRLERGKNASNEEILRVWGGDSWRILVLESSSDLRNWSEVKRETNYYDFAEEPAFEVVIPPSACIFYRVKGI